VALAIPKLRSGSYFPDWLLQHRRRAEQALVSVVATSYLLGVSTRRVEKLVEQLGVASLSKSQVSEMAAHLDAQVEAFRNRPLDVAEIEETLDANFSSTPTLTSTSARPAWVVLAARVLAEFGDDKKPAATTPVPARSLASP
jgi:hypothetical protein